MLRMEGHANIAAALRACTWKTQRMLAMLGIMKNRRPRPEDKPACFFLLDKLQWVILRKPCPAIDLRWRPDWLFASLRSSLLLLKKSTDEEDRLLLE